MPRVQKLHRKRVQPRLDLRKLVLGLVHNRLKRRALSIDIVPLPIDVPLELIRVLCETIHLLNGPLDVEQREGKIGGIRDQVGWKQKVGMQRIRRSVIETLQSLCHSLNAIL